MIQTRPEKPWKMPRRDFLCAAGMIAAGMALGPRSLISSARAAPAAGRRLSYERRARAGNVCVHPVLPLPESRAG